MLRTLCFLNGAALKEDGTVPKLASGGSVRILSSQALYQDRPCREAPVRARGERPRDRPSPSRLLSAVTGARWAVLSD